MDRNLPNSPIVEDVNWSDLEDIVPLEEHMEEHPRELPRSTFPPPLPGILPKRKRKLFHPREVLSPEEKAERRRKIKTARRKELRAEKKANDPNGHAAELKINNEKVKKRRQAFTQEERKEFNEKSRVRQQHYRQQSMEKTGFATKYYKDIREIKELVVNGKASDEQLAKLAKYTEKQRRARKIPRKKARKPL